MDPARAERVAQRRRERLGRHERLHEARQRDAELVRALENDAQERRRADITRRTQVSDRGDLQLGLADAAREYRATQRMRAGLEHRAGRRQVVREAVVHEVAGTKACSEERARKTPIVARLALRLVDAAGRCEYAPQFSPLRGGEAAERPLGALQFAQRRLAHHREARERFPRAHRLGIDVAKRARESRRICLRVRDLPRKRSHLRLLALCRVARFQRVVMLTHRTTPPIDRRSRPRPHWTYVACALTRVGLLARARRRGLRPSARLRLARRAHANHRLRRR